jgi:prepilin-type N-terminal cleavage/methylation domain-containing protein
MCVSSEAARRARGFTLIELALVLLILGILASLAAPALSVLGTARIDAEARRLASVISYLHDEASLRGRVYRLTFDLDTESYAVEVARADTGEFVSPRSEAGWDPYAPESRRVAEGVAISSVETATGTVSTGDCAVFFLPEDARESFKVVLEAESGMERRLEADGVTGQVAVADETESP